MSKIKCIDHTILTSLTVKEVALAFRDGLGRRGRGLTGLVSRHALEWDFFTPEQQDDPFAGLEPSDEPAFSAGAGYGARSKQRYTKFSQYVAASIGGAVLLNVWDRGGYREILLRHAGDLSPASRNQVDVVISDLRTADPRLRLTSKKGRLG
jgi:hypothetical protein